jgi:hypothetical protein
VSLHGTVLPTSVLSPHHTPRRRMVIPSKGVRPSTRRPSRHRDVRMMEHISVTFSPVRPSPSLCHHPRHCRAIPNTMGTRADGTPPLRPLYSSRSPLAGPSSWRTDHDQARIPARPPSKPPLDKHRSHRDARQGRDSPGRPSNDTYCAPCRHTSPKALRHNCKPPPLGL